MTKDFLSIVMKFYCLKVILREILQLQAQLNVYNWYHFDSIQFKSQSKYFVRTIFSLFQIIDFNFNKEKKNLSEKSLYN